MNLWLANPRGFCAGVDRAVTIVGELLSLVSEPVYVRHEIVHNRSVVDGLRARGAVFVEAIDEIPERAFAVISAHGAPPKVMQQARDRNIRLFDATCPLVSKVHLEVLEHSRRGRAVFLIGHRDHVEVIGTIGYYDNPLGGGIYVIQDEQEARDIHTPSAHGMAYVTQTTLAVDASDRIVKILRRRFPSLIGPRHQDICYATQNRQDAVRMLCSRCDRIIVIGAPHSSNSQRMVEVAREAGTPGHLIETADEIDPEWFLDALDVGLTASASAPEHLLLTAVQRIRALVPKLKVCELGLPENVVFKLPAALLDMRQAR